jgi:hypothetical protein
VTLSLAGTTTVAVALGFVVAGRRDELTHSLQSAPLWILGLVVLLQVVALLARTGLQYTNFSTNRGDSINGRPDRTIRPFPCRICVELRAPERRRLCRTRDDPRGSRRAHAVLSALSGALREIGEMLVLR